jgi:hypothetical protein
VLANARLYYVTCQVEPDVNIVEVKADQSREAIRINRPKEDLNIY